MDAVLSFARDVRNWLGFVVGCVAVLIGLAICYVIGRAVERRLPDPEEEPQEPVLIPVPPLIPPAAPAAPEVSISSYCWPEESAEVHAWITGLPPDTLIEFGDAMFTAAQVERLVALRERRESEAR